MNKFAHRQHQEDGRSDCGSENNRGQQAKRRA
jgi:hypothetical protein